MRVIAGEDYLSSRSIQHQESTGRCYEQSTERGASKGRLHAGASSDPPRPSMPRLALVSRRHPMTLCAFNQDPARPCLGNSQAAHLLVPRPPRREIHERHAPKSCGIQRCPTEVALFSAADTFAGTCGGARVTCRNYAEEGHAHGEGCDVIDRTVTRGRENGRWTTASSAPSPPPWAVEDGPKQRWLGSE
jgi:hypothetical protein